MIPPIRTERLMRTHFALLLLPLLAACEQTTDGLVVSNTPPQIVIDSPAVNAAGDPIDVEAEAGVAVRAQVSDTEDAGPEVAVSWLAFRTDDPATPAVDFGATTPDNAGETTLLVTGLVDGRWTLQVTAMDSGGLTDQATLPLLVLSTNAAPEVAITAPAPGAQILEGTLLTFAGTAVDDRGPSNLGVEWFDSLDGVLDESPPSTAGLLTFSTDTLSVGPHAVTLTATDANGLSGSAVVVFDVVPADTAPTTPQVLITPAAPRTGDDLTCSLTVPSVDPEGQAIAHTFRWLRDGQPTGLTGPLLSFGETARDEAWTCSVVGSDGTLESAAGEATVTVGNTAPSVSAALLGPSPAIESSLLTCSGSGWLDEDDDAEDYDVAWFIDGLPIAATGPTLDGSSFDRDDAVSCELTPFDGTDLGLPVLSAELIIENTPPATPVVWITPSPVASISDALVCGHGLTSDADPGDSPSLEVAWLVDGAPAPSWDGLLTVAASATHLGQDWTCQVRANDGTDVSPWATATVTVLPAPGDLVITEYMADPALISDAAGEWIELYNNSGATLDLQGLELHDDGSESHVISTSLAVATGQRVVLARNIDPGSNGGVQADYEYSGFTLQNSDAIVLDFDGIELDRVTYNLSFWSGIAGHSVSLDPTIGPPDATLNDSPSNWCGSTIPLTTPGSDFGTPGGPNDTCLCWASDTDGDGFGDHPDCSFYDCSDENASISPAGTEVCENGIDEDCSGADLTCDCLDTDDDGDGYGDGGGCLNIDCDDANSTIHPLATELCNGVDDNCTGGVDEGFDGDGDGWTSCAGDCNNSLATVHPAASEVCDGLDNNCNGGVDEGFDGDGDGWTSCAGDCNNGNASIHPGANDGCNGVDDDCDGTLDENAAGDAYEPNNDSNSSYVALGNDASVTLAATIHVASDQNDWYLINALDDTEFPFDTFHVTAQLTSIPPGTDYDLYLYDASLNLLDSSLNGSNNPETVSHASDPFSIGNDGGAFYVRVKRYSGQSCSDTYLVSMENGG
jgi:hypothetical protein